MTDTPAGRANAANDNPNVPSDPTAAAHTRAMLQNPELPLGTGGDANAPSLTPAADNAAAASGDGTSAGLGGNAPSSSPSPAAAAVGGNEPSPSPAATAAAAAGGNAPSSSPSPAAAANNTTAGDGGAGAAGGANAAPAAAGGAFPGYPRSGGLLSPQLSSLLVAIQEAHLYNDSKTAV
jgi:hypothetical protein